MLFSVLAFCALPAAPDDMEKPAKKEQTESDLPDFNIGSKEDFDLICTDAGITGEQLDKIHELAAKRVERLKEWASSDDGKKYVELRKQMTALRRERAAQLKKTESSTEPVDYDAKIKELAAETRPVAKQLTDLRNSTRGEILKTLTPEQQEKAVTANLGRRIDRLLEGASLTEEQKPKVQAIVTESAQEYLKKTTFDQDPTMAKLLGVQNTAAKRIREDVLTEEQREAIKKKKTPTTDKTE
jgi:Spy/CpxP family protein refolding chaperone